jgi:hypothetical protein
MIIYEVTSFFLVSLTLSLMIGRDIKVDMRADDPDISNINM